jgi:hypothetical protein
MKYWNYSQDCLLAPPAYIRSSEIAFLFKVYTYVYPIPYVHII